VTCVDASALAGQFIERNAALNQVSGKVTATIGDAFETLQAYKQANRRFDVVIIDPPAFIKRRKDITNGRRLNELAVRLLAPNGLLVSASCSLHMPEAELTHCVQLAFAKQQRLGRLIHRGQQGFDHPIHPAIPETAYLKALFCVAD
jgi:23S rRNA (cytosine1962-C5)-methyltransferase